jgi:hypothetical protein
MNTLPTSTPGSGNVNKERGPDDVRVEADHDECNGDFATVMTSAVVQCRTCSLGCADATFWF